MFGIDSILVDVCERSKKWIVIISLRVQKFGDDECAQIQEDMEHNSFLDVDKNDKKIKPPHPFKNVSKTATFSIQTTDMPYQTGTVRVRRSELVALLKQRSGSNRKCQQVVIY